MNSAAPARLEDNRLPEEPLESRIRGISYDLEQFEKAVGEINPHRQFLGIVLEFIAAKESWESIEGNWYLITVPLLEAVQDRAFLEWAVNEICDFIQETDDRAAKKLLQEIIGELKNARDIVWVLEQMVLPRGMELVDSFLHHIATTGRARAIPVLSALHRDGKEALTQLAEPHLIRLASNPTLFANWVLEDPDSLLRPDVISSIIEQVPPVNFREAFKVFFSQAGIEIASRFLVQLPAGIQGAEVILFSAMDHGVPLIRKLGIAQLHKYPLPIVISTLIGIVRGNNFKQSLEMPEVEAALEALTRIDHPEAAAFLKTVLHRRRWFRPVYRKEIRRALWSLMQGRK